MGRIRAYACSCLAALILLGPTPAAAAGPLSGLTLSSPGYVSGLGPDFSAANHYYQVVTDNPVLNVNPGGPADVSLAGMPVPLGSDGAAVLHLERGRNDVTVGAYHLAVWFGSAPQPGLVAVSGPRPPGPGGDFATLIVRDGTLPSSSCSAVSVRIGGRPAPVYSSVLDPVTGLTRLAIRVSGVPADIALDTACASAGLSADDDNDWAGFRRLDLHSGTQSTDGPPPAIARIGSVSDLGHPLRDQFHPTGDPDTAFLLTGAGLAGTDAAATRVIVSEPYGGDELTLTPEAITDDALVFAAPRTLRRAGPKEVTVVTDRGRAYTMTGLDYLAAGYPVSVDPARGSCDSTTRITSTGALFGGSGVVTVGGAVVEPASYTPREVDLDPPGRLGSQDVVIVPDDVTLAPQRVHFTCLATLEVVTTVNGGTGALTVPAGMPFTMGATTTGLIGGDELAAGFEYVTAGDFNTRAYNGFGSPVVSGVPRAAGDYYVRVAVTYDRERYLLAGTPAPVHVTITGIPITVTPVSGPQGVTYAVTPDYHVPIDKVTFEYRNSTCSAQPDYYFTWTEGLPEEAAIANPDCGGDGSTPVPWDVRVRSIEMSGPDDGLYYLVDRPSIPIDFPFVRAEAP